MDNNNSYQHSAYSSFDLPDHKPFHDTNFESSSFNSPDPQPTHNMNSDFTSKSNSLMFPSGNSYTFKQLATTGLFGASALFGLFILSRYSVARSNEYLVRTGLFIDGISINKKAFHLPFQTCRYLGLTPNSYSFTIHAMSKEKMAFILPAVFTIGPKDSEDHLYAYSKYLLYESPDNVREIVRGMIEGETRVLAASMSVEDIFKGRTEFKENIVKSVQIELDKLGLTVFNANIKELQDSEQSKYFSYLAQKISADAENQAKIDIAEARRKGNIGEKEREGTTRQRVSEINSQATIFENERKNEMEKSVAELEQRRAEYSQQVQIARLESELSASKRQEELQKEVELKRLEREVEKRRATELSKARVEAEIKATDAHGESSAMQALADARQYTSMREADAALYTQIKEADGLQAMYQAQADGLQKIVGTFGGDSRALLNYLMIEKDLYPKLADASARAIQGLNPKITVWNTTHGEGEANSTFNSISSIAKSIPPIIQTIEQQTGMALPDWIVKKKSMPEGAEDVLKIMRDSDISPGDVRALVKKAKASGLLEQREADISSKIQSLQGKVTI